MFFKIHSFFIRTSKFCFMLVALNFFFIFETEMLLNSLFPQLNLAIPQRRCQTEYYKNTLFHFFHSFSFNQRTSAATGRCFTKNRFYNCAKTNQKILAKEFHFSSKSATLPKLNSFTGIFHRF